jgi:hypothetical protein
LQPVAGCPALREAWRKIPDPCPYLERPRINLDDAKWATLRKLFIRSEACKPLTLALVFWVLAGKGLLDVSHSYGYSDRWGLLGS